MATSIKIQTDTKTELDKLQARLILKLGKKISQQELIDILVRMGAKNIEKMLEFNFLKKESIDEVLSLSSKWKIKTEPDILDDILVRD